MSERIYKITINTCLVVVVACVFLSDPIGAYGHVLLVLAFLAGIIAAIVHFYTHTRGYNEELCHLDSKPQPQPQSQPQQSSLTSRLESPPTKVHAQSEPTTKSSRPS
jgi:hypothetical protein